jgi:hypothetical protein
LEPPSFIDALSNKFPNESFIPTQSKTLLLCGKISFQHPTYISTIAVLACLWQCSCQGCEAIPVANGEVFDIGDHIVDIFGDEDWVYSLLLDTVIFLSLYSNIVMNSLEYFVRYVQSVVDIGGDVE